jgi:hypothetical protein
LPGLPETGLKEKVGRKSEEEEEEMFLGLPPLPSAPSFGENTQQVGGNGEGGYVEEDD